MNQELNEERIDLIPKRSNINSKRKSSKVIPTKPKNNKKSYKNKKNK
jgi:hypothetical protein